MGRESSNNPESSEPWQASWCWPEARSPRPWNRYAFFRRVVNLPAKPASAPLRISADARYTLTVNGRWLHHGPARSFPHHQSFDTVDLADLLQPGTNVLCIVAHQFGVPTSQSAYRDASGLIVDGVIESGGVSIPLHTPGDWVCRMAKGWRQHVERLSDSLGFQEHFDADADPADWQSPDYAAPAEDGWHAPVIIAPASGFPWSRITPRGAPLLASHLQPFTHILAQFTGENARGYKVSENILTPASSEDRKKLKAGIENPEALLRDDDQAATIPPPPDGHFHMLVLDAGVTRTAHVILDIMEAAGDEIIDILYTNDLDRAGEPPLPDPDATTSAQALADRYRCRPGQQRWEPFLPKGFRYAALLFRNVEKPLKIRHISLRALRAAIEPAGRFECSDESLTAIYRAGVETLKACALDALINCPDTRQARRWDAARLQFRAAAYAFGDAALLQRGIEQVALSQVTDGSPHDGALHAFPPAEAPSGWIVDSMLAWVATLVDHHTHTSRADLLARHRPALDRLLAFLARHENDDGLIGAFASTGFDVYLDSRDLRRDDFSAVLNLLYLQALRHASTICNILEDESAATTLTARAGALAERLSEKLWDPDVNLFKDGIDPATGAPIEQVSVHANALAILLDLHPEHHTDIARDVIHKTLVSRRTKTISPSPSFAAFALDALIHAGLRAEAVEVIAAKWGAMTTAGAATCWEQWDGLLGSRCFGSATAPVYLLPQQILGVTPIEPGWRKLRIAPLIGKLEFARGAIPTPLGLVRVEWERVGEDQLAVRVELPDGIEAQFVSPLGETRALNAGASEFHT